MCMSGTRPIQDRLGQMRGMNMDFQQLYTNTDGRINRKTWWLGFIGLTIISILIGIVLGVVAGLMGSIQSAFLNGLISLLILAILFVPYRAITYKRLHDRSRPEILFLIFIGPQILLSILTMVGLAGGPGTQVFFGQEIETFKYNVLGNALNAISTVVGLWSLVELGFLKGDDGPNAHGPDPLS